MLADQNSILNEMNEWNDGMNEFSYFSKNNINKNIGKKGKDITNFLSTKCSQKRLGTTRNMLQTH